MKPYPDFLDSTLLLADGVALRERLSRDGYLFIRNLLPRQAILAVQERLLRKAAEGGWLDPAQPLEAGIANPDAACKDPEDRYMRVFRNLWQDEALHRLRIHPVILDLFTRIFGDKQPPNTADPIDIPAIHTLKSRMRRKP